MLVEANQSDSYIRTNSYFVKTEKFEGPLDVLLDLIHDEKLDIAEISLAQVTDQYLDYLKQLPQSEPALLADFLVVAAQLILIKSKSLLPSLEVTAEEELGIAELQARLKQLQIFKAAAGLLKDQEKKHLVSYGRDVQFGAVTAFLPPIGLKSRGLLAVLKDLLKETVSVEKLKQETVKVVVSFETVLAKLKGRIQKALQTNFSKVVQSAKSKMEVVITFLALLELVKQKLVAVEQEGQFEEIEIKTNKGN